MGLVIPSSFMREPEYRNFFFVRPTFRDEVGRIVAQLKETGHRRMAILYQDNAAGQDALEGFKQAAQSLQVRAEVQVRYGRDASNVPAAMGRILATEPDSIILLSNSAAAAAATAVKVARARGFRGQLIGTSVIDPASIVSLAGHDNARGLGLVQVMPNPLDRIKPLSIEFREAMVQLRPGVTTFSPIAMEGYVAAKVVAAAIASAGTHPKPRDVYRELDRMKALDLGGFRVSFSDGNRTGSKYSALAVVDAQGKLLY